MRVITGFVNNMVDSITMAPIATFIVEKDSKFIMVTSNVTYEFIQDLQAGTLMVSIEDVVSKFDFSKSIELSEDEVLEIQSSDSIRDDGTFKQLRRNIKLNKLGI